MKKINITKFKLNEFLKSSIFIGQHKKLRNNILNKHIYKTKKNIDVFNLNKIFYTLKVILPLLTTLVEKKAKLLIINDTIMKNKSIIKQIPTKKLNGIFSNFKLIKQHKNYIKKIPTLILYFSKNTNLDLIKEITKTNIPYIELIDSNKQLNNPTYAITTNINSKTINTIYIPLINQAVKIGHIKEIYKFSKKKFPRLDSNQ